MKDKVVSARNAVELIQPYDTVFTSGFVGTGTPEALIKALEQRYLRTEAPSDITLVFAAAPGDGDSRGVNRLAHPGLIRRIIGGHWGLVPKLGALALENRIEAYNLPLGVMSQLFREIAGGRGCTRQRINGARGPDARQPRDRDCSAQLRRHRDCPGRAAGRCGNALATPTRADASRTPTRCRGKVGGGRRGPVSGSCETPSQAQDE
jgi:hypothetical protein